MDFTIDELTALVLQHGRLAKRLRMAADEHEKLSQVYLEMGKRIRREAEEKESKVNIKRIISGVSILIILAALFVGLFLSNQSRTLAQDAPAATAITTISAAINGQPVAATLEPTVAPTPQPTNGTYNEQDPSQDRVPWIVGFVVITVFGGIALWLKDRSVNRLTDIVETVLNNKMVLEESREKYLQASLPAQEWWKFFANGFSILGGLNIPVLDPVFDAANNALKYATTGEELPPEVVAGMGGLPVSPDFLAGYNAAVTAAVKKPSNAS